ncbi:hypothetical protein H5410_045268 [Solanum commersonii]|uniref:Uncharacterized protein n=1 Tax=Solanum commersonii TaxID=4109 RepID=A0A9J5XAL5_SOLCO|nr:hypothetical protein H5410_045268 [Solanum commersonii]
MRDRETEILGCDGNMGYNILLGSLSRVSRDRQYIRRSTLWSGLSPFSFFLQHLRILIHWATKNCFTKLLGDAPTAPFSHRLDLFLRGRHTGTLGEVKTIWQLA